MTAAVAQSSKQNTDRIRLIVSGLCWLAIFFDGFDTFVYGTVVPPLLRDQQWHLTPAQAGVIGSYATLGMLFGALIAGIVTDAIGRKRAMLACVTLFALAAAICALAPTPGVFGAARFVAGLGLGGLIPTAMALVFEYAPRGRGNTAITVMMTAHQSGGIIVALLAISLLPALGWRSMFWAGFIPIVVVAPLLVMLLPESISFLIAKGRHAEAEQLARSHGIAIETAVNQIESEEKAAAARGSNLEGLITLVSKKYLRATLLFWITSFMGLLLVYGVSAWLPELMRRSGYSLGSSLAFLMVINLGGIVGLLIAGRAADRFGPQRVCVLWFALTAICVALLSVKMPLIATYTVVMSTGIWLFSAQTLLYANVAHYYPTSGHATAIGWAAGIGRLGAVVGPTLGGLLLSAHLLNWNFYAFAVAAVIAAFSISSVPRSPLIVGASSPSGVRPAMSH